MVAKRMRMKRVLKELDMRPTEGQLMRDVIEGMQARGQNVTEAEVENEVFSLEVLQELVEAFVLVTHRTPAPVFRCVVPQPLPAIVPQVVLHPL